MTFFDSETNFFERLSPRHVVDKIADAKRNLKSMNDEIFDNENIVEDEDLVKYQHRVLKVPRLQKKCLKKWLEKIH